MPLCGVSPHDAHDAKSLGVLFGIASLVHPKEAQALARHSTITLTMDRYTQSRLGGLDERAGSAAGARCLFQQRMTNLPARYSKQLLADTQADKAI